jgi:hypothetical protein
MSGHKTLGSLILIAWLAAPATGLAQDGRGGELTLYVGTFSASGGIHLVGPQGAYEIDTDIEPDGYSFGLLGGYTFGRIAGVEFGFSLATNHQTAILTVRQPGRGGGSNETNLLTLAHGNGVVHLPVPGRIVPYASAGAGILGTVGPATNLAFNVGGGIKVALSRRIGVRLDVRHYRSNFEDVLSQAVFTGNASDRCDDFDLQQFVCSDTPFEDPLRFTEVSAGLTVRFPLRESR